MNKMLLKMLSRFNIRVSCILFALCFSSTSLSEDVPVWSPITKSKDAKYLFVAFQEAEFVREQLGEWLPKAMYEISSGELMYYSVSWVAMDDSQIGIELTIWDPKTDKKSTLVWRWTKPSEAKTVNVIATPGLIEVRYPETEEVRKIILSEISDIPSAKKKFIISGSSPLWQWNITPW